MITTLGSITTRFLKSPLEASFAKLACLLDFKGLQLSSNELLYQKSRLISKLGFFKLHSLIAHEYSAVLVYATHFANQTSFANLYLRFLSINPNTRL